MFRGAVVRRCSLCRRRFELLVRADVVLGDVRRSDDRCEQLRCVRNGLSHWTDLRGWIVSLPDGAERVRERVHQHADRRTQLRHVRNRVSDRRVVRERIVPVSVWTDGVRRSMRGHSKRRRQLRPLR